MPGSSDTRRPVGLVGLAGVLLVVAAVVAACATGTAGATGTPAAPSQAAAASPGSVAASPTDTSPSPSEEAASPTAKGGGRYGGGYGGGASPSPMPAPTPAGKALTVKVGSTGMGKVLVGANGLTLYTLASDHTNSSTCTGTCVDDWPPLTVKSGTKVLGGPGVKGTFATFARADGTRQVSYRGKPLYYFAGDRSAGDTNGEGIGGVWFVAKP